ncbi:MAG: long-chain-acyl-CoA synthetase [Proteobacteria bacterium]|nr:long-chain-acyl-CoA synthetase [Pseudomonadota bacterium]
MSNTGTSAKTEYSRIKFREFIPGLFSFMKIMPSVIKAVKEMKAMEPETCKSLGSYIEENAVNHADNAALLFESQRYTYREFNEQCNRVANYFLSLGTKKGDVVVVLLENRPELLFCIVGLAKIGAIASLINPNLRGAVLEHCVTIEPAKHFVVDEELVEAFEEIRSNIDINPASKIHFLAEKGENPLPEGYVDLNTELAGASTANPTTTGQMQTQDPFCYIFTSGTTGKPKAAIIDNARWIGAKFGFGAEMALTPDDKVYIPLPFSHSTALLVVWGPAVHGGAATVMRRKFSASNFWKDVKEYKVTAFGYIGELCRYLMNQPPQPGDADNTVKKIIGNGLRPDIWKEFKKRFAIPKIYEFYAASEGNVAFANMMNLDCTVGFGFSPYAVAKYDVEADEPIRDAKGFLQKVKKGEAGLLLGEITEDNRFVGYTNEDATQSKIIRNAFDEGDAWFNTGDLIKNIGYGHCQFVDRVGDTFRWKGENVSTTEVEEVITTLDPVKESTVYGVSIPGTEGRAGMASLIAKMGLDNFDFDGFAAALKRSLPSYAVPIFIRFQAEFETTATMKRIKSRLKQGGFDPRETNDPLYVLLPGESRYTALTEELYAEIADGKYRF